MDGFNRGQYASTALRKSGIAGDFCLQFAEALNDKLPEIAADLSGMIDMDGLSAGVMLNLQSPHKSDNIYLEVFVLEERRHIVCNFSGFRRNFVKSDEAIDFIHKVLTDKIVILTRYENRRLADESIEELEDALEILDESSRIPPGCLAYMVPRKLERIWIRSWTGKQNQNSHNY